MPAIIGQGGPSPFCSVSVVACPVSFVGPPSVDMVVVEVSAVFVFIVVIVVGIGIVVVVESSPPPSPAVVVESSPAGTDHDQRSPYLACS
jgi:hypothetical protein